MPEEAISSLLFDTYKSPSKADILQIRSKGSEANGDMNLDAEERKCQDIKPSYRGQNLYIKPPENKFSSKCIRDIESATIKRMEFF